MTVWLWESQIEFLLEMLKKRQARAQKRPDGLEFNITYEIMARLEGKVTGPEWTLNEEDPPSQQA